MGVNELMRDGVDMGWVSPILFPFALSFLLYAIICCFYIIVSLPTSTYAGGRGGGTRFILHAFKNILITSLLFTALVLYIIFVWQLFID